MVELYRKTATELPKDVFRELKKAESIEEGNPKDNIKSLIENARLAKELSKPICQDTGTPIFYVQYDKRFSQKELKDKIIKATKKATSEIPLRPNSVDINDKNSGDNTGDYFPVIYFEEIEKGLKIDLMLKGGGTENVGLTYKLPDDKLNAPRNLEGVKKCVLDAVFKAQGKACPPYILGVAIGGSKDVVSFLSKKQLLREISDKNKDDKLRALEKELGKEINKLGIGPLGLGGKTTCLGVKIATSSRHPASYFVDISFCCWACRRGRLEYD